MANQLRAHTQKSIKALELDGWLEKAGVQYRQVIHQNKTDQLRRYRYRSCLPAILLLYSPNNHSKSGSDLNFRHICKQFNHAATGIEGVGRFDKQHRRLWRRFVRRLVHLRCHCRALSFEVQQHAVHRASYSLHCAQSGLINFTSGK